MATFTGQLISATYDAIIKTVDNDPIGSTAKLLTDGLGNSTPLYVSNTQIGIGITPTEALHVSGNALITGSITIDTNATISGNLSWGSLTDTGESITITKFVDAADGIANNNNDTSIPTSAAVKSLVDSSITAQDLDFSGDNGGTGSVDLDSQIFAINGTTNQITTVQSGQSLTIALPTNITIGGIVNATTFSGDLNGTINTLTTAVTQAAGDNSTKVSTTAYADAAASAVPIGDYLPLAGGTMIGNTSHNDNIMSIYGTGSDLQIYHDGVDSFIKELGVGALKITSNHTLFYNVGYVKLLAEFDDIGVKLYYNNVKKFETTSTGIDINGRISNLTNPSAAQDAATKSYVDSQVGDNNELSEVLANGNTTGGTDIAVSAADDITFTDTSKALFGAGNDLEIYHNGTNSVIDNNTNNLLISTASQTIISSDATDNQLTLGQTSGNWFAKATNSNTLVIGSESNATNNITLDTSNGGSATFAGEVGIGTSTANFDSKLQVAGRIRANGGVNGGYFFGTTEFDGGFYAPSDGNIAFSTNNVERLGIDSNGNATFAGQVSVGNYAIPSDHQFQIAHLGQSYARFGLTNSQTGNGSSDGLKFQMEGLNSIIKNQENGYLTFGTNGRETDLKIDSSGNSTFAGSVTGGNDVFVPQDKGIFFNGASDFSSGIAGTSAGQGVRIFAGGSAKVTINSSGNSTFAGNVNVGTTGTKIVLTSAGDAYNTILRSWQLSAAVGNVTYPTYGFYGNTGTGMYSAATDTLAFTTGAVERMRIDSSGNVGIGTTSPSNYNSYGDNLVVADSAHAGISIASGTTSLGTLMFADGTGGTAGYRGRVQYDHNTDSMNFHTSATERMRIDSSGNIMMGKTSQSSNAALTVKSMDGGNTGIILVEGDTTNDGYGLYATTDNKFVITRYTNGSFSDNFIIDSNGNVGIGTTSPAVKFVITGGGGALSENGFQINSGNGHSGTGVLEINPSATSHIPLSILSKNGQTANLVNVTSFGGTAGNLFSIASGGNVGIGNAGTFDNPNSYSKVIEIANNDAVGLILNDTRDSNPMSIDNSGAVMNLRYNTTSMLVLDGATSNATFAGSIQSKATQSASTWIEGNGSGLNYGMDLFLTNDLGSTQGATRLRSAYGDIGTAGTPNFSISRSTTTQAYNSNPNTLTYSESLVIDGANGNVGIGITNPSQLLHVNSTTSNPTGIGLQNSQRYYSVRSNNYSLVFTDETVGTERMRIDNSGNVGIGDTSPTSISANTFSLSVNSSRTDLSGALISKANGTVKHQQYWDSSGYSFNLSASSGNFKFNGGNVGIGTTSPTYGKITVTESGSAYTGDYIYGGTNGSYGALRCTLSASNGPSFIDFFRSSYSNTVPVGAIVTSGSNCLYQSYSDYRMKENVSELTGALDKVNNIQPKTFNYKEDTETTYQGFIAHELQEIVPQAVSGKKDEVNEDGTPKYQGVDNSHIVPLLVGAIQELKAEIEQLKTQINN